MYCIVFAYIILWIDAFIGIVAIIEEFYCHKINDATYVASYQYASSRL